MPKQARLNGIKAIHCYTFQEAADATSVSARTIRTWARMGLPVMAESRPALIRGDDLRDFIQGQRSERKVLVALDELYCLPCRAARRPAEGMADCEVNGARATLTGLCPRCATVMSKPIAKARIPEIARTLDLKITRHDETL